MFQVTRPGDHLLTPFQCDLCVFRWLKQEDPNDTTSTDRVLLACIRRANLDAFWSWVTGAVRNDRNAVRRSTESVQCVGLAGPHCDPGPAPDTDVVGYETALAALADTAQKAVCNDAHEQWDSSQKTKMAIGNWEKLHVNHPLSHLTL